MGALIFRLAFKEVGKRLMGLLTRFFPEPKTFRQHLRQNLLLGLCVALIVVALQGTHNVAKSRSDSLDWLIGLQRGLAIPEGVHARPFVFYDIDDATMAAWGDPLFTPRDKLATLVDAALQQAPAALVVDVELWRGTAQDAALIAVLRDHASKADAPLLVLLPGFRQTDDEGNGARLVLRPSGIEAVLPPSARRIWASPLFEADRDGQFRHWKLWQAYCTPNGDSGMIPSVQIAVLAGLHADAGNAGLAQALAMHRPRECGGPPPPEAGALHVGDLTLDTKASDYGQRILFSIPWKLGPDESRPEVMVDGRPWRLLTVVPAKAVTEGGIRPTVAPGHIAVIGASNQDARDIHATPLGMLPGSLILINAMHSVITHGQVRAPSLALQLITSLVLLSTMSFIFARFPSVVGTIATFAVLLLVLVPLSIYFFRYGIWIDFAIPALVIKVFQAVLTYMRKHNQSEKAKQSGASNQ